MAENFSRSSSPPPLPGEGRTPADLINWLESLYQTALNLTEKAEEKSIELDKQMAIEGTRKAILEEADEIFREVNLALSRDSNLPDTDPNWTLLDEKKEKLISLIKEIQSVDQKRVVLFQEEKMAIQQLFFQFNLGKQAVTKYQQTSPVED